MTQDTRRYDSFGAPADKTIGGRACSASVDMLGNAFSTAQISGTISKLCGNNVLNNVTATNVHAAGGNAAANIGSQAQGMQAIGQIQEAKCQFAAQQQQVQNQVGAAMKQAAADCKMDMGVVNNTFKAQSGTDAFSLMGGSLATGGVGVNVASALYDVQAAMKPTLNKDQKAKLAECVVQIMAPPAGAQQQPGSSHGLNQNYIAQLQGKDAVEMLNNVYKPLDQHPEMIALNNAQNAVDCELNHHLSMKDNNEATLQTAQTYGVNHQDFDAKTNGPLNEGYIQARLAEMKTDAPANQPYFDYFAALPPVQQIQKPAPYDIGMTKQGLAVLNKAAQNDAAPVFNHEPPSQMRFNSQMLGT
ncbi:MAG: hypothetical protein KTR28_03395 [Micavibrio sp.]|nr:hypothetical protein [Micavibrio sp.]